ncbi:MAG: SDR family oxidoreductase, partial [Kordiimonadaceae bacterium]|nr:SDR family oxidoreductase [Kordiimonadaceae bacterium]
MRFSGKNIIVTGGTSGFGEAIVKAFASEGAHVHFCGLIDSEGARVQEEVNALVKSLLESPESTAETVAGSGQYHHADVRDEESVKAFIAAATAPTGTLDIAVNNAGVSHKAARFVDQDPAMVSDVLQTNVMGIWHAMRHEIPLMLNDDGGAIINIASILSESGAEWMAAYGTSKHAVVGLTKS